MLCQLNEVNEHLFIGSARSVTDDSLKQKGITCVINCSLLSPTYALTGIKYFPLMVEDNEKENISRYFDEITNLIDEERECGGKTLVYCVAGISRSATLCIAYLMKYGNLNLRNAFKHLRSRRKIVRPNNGFFTQLIDYELKLYDQASVNMVPISSPDSPDVLIPDVFNEVCKGIVWLRSTNLYRVSGLRMTREK